MKPLVKVLCATLLLAPLAIAGPGKGQKGATAGPGPDRPGGGARLVQSLEQIASELGLNADQQTKIDGILRDVPAKMRELAEQTQDMQPRERATRVRDLMAETRTAIESELTAEQKVEFSEKIDALRAERQARRGQRQGAQNGDQQSPQTQPSQRRRQAGQAQPGLQMIDRIETAVGKLDLSADQKTQTEKVIADLKTQLQDIRANANGDVEAARTQAREAFGKARQEIAQSLDKEQRQKLRELMQAEGGPGNGPPGERANRRQREAKPEQGTSPPTTAPSSNATPNTKPAADAAGVFVLESALTRVGQVAPELQLFDLNAKPLTLRSLIKSRPLVLVAGSYSSPVFRDRVPDLREMKRQLGARADVCVVYTAEAHPAGEWDVERNRDAGISVPAHQSAEDRLAAAKTAKKQLDLDVTLVIDDMTNPCLIAFANKPNAAVLLDREGRILLFQNWFEPHAMRRTIDELKS